MAKVGNAWIFGLSTGVDQASGNPAIGEAFNPIGADAGPFSAGLSSFLHLRLVALFAAYDARFGEEMQSVGGVAMASPPADVSVLLRYSEACSIERPIGPGIAFERRTTSARSIVRRRTARFTRPLLASHRNDTLRR